MINFKLLSTLSSGIPFAIVLLYVLDFFSPHMQVKNALMSADLSLSLELQSGGNIVKQLFWITALFVSFWYFLRNKIFELKLNREQLIFAGLVLFLFVSSLWANDSGLTLKRALFQLILILTIFFSISSIQYHQKFLFIVYLAFSLLLVWEVAFSIIFSSFAFDISGALSGIHSGKNQFGVAAFLGCAISLQQYLNNRYMVSERNKMFALMTLFGWIVLLLLSRSKTCIFLAIVVLLFFIIRRSSLNLMLFTKLFMIASTVVLSVTTFLSLYLYDDVVKIYENIFDFVELTGRGEIWTLSLYSFSEKSLLGYGFSSFWGTGDIPYYFNVEYSYLRFLNQSHNGYLDLLLQIGIVGGALFGFFLFSFVNKGFQKQHVFYISVLFFSLMHNFTESSFLRDQHITWFFLLVIIFARWFLISEKERL
jgi:exopolysaccharide production protein ExoQ